MTGQGSPYSRAVRALRVGPLVAYKRLECIPKLISNQPPLTQNIFHSSTQHNAIHYFFAVLATAITMVQAGCYSGGESWAPDQVQANNELNGLCDNLAGGFSGGQEKYACRNAGTANKRLEFWVKNTAGNSLSLTTVTASCV
ncbi:hypothetical protein BKA70DRAFT_1540396 [Coprinopsis sp. MPI-PUGE-AT-0042]|nr:hypothetical protein BKA70DRAFT_1540396 [Coprinopsis sp. MPI-PUGE-AT-0042]